MPDPYNFMADFETGSSGSPLPSTPYNPTNWHVPLPGAGTTIQHSGSDVNWGGVIGAAAPIVASLFAGDRGSIAPQIGEVQKNARDIGAQGRQLFAQGQDTLHPALEYFKGILSDNPGEVMAATAPERRRVIDQYDTARRSAGQFTPRGGGQASASMESRAQQASDLATIGGDARRQAANATAAIGTSQQDAGLSAEEQSQAQLAQMLGPLFQQQQSDSQSTLGTIAGLASLAAMFI